MLNPFSKRVKRQYSELQTVQPPLHHWEGHGGAGVSSVKAAQEFGGWSMCPVRGGEGWAAVPT